MSTANDVFDFLNSDAGRKILSILLTLLGFATQSGWIPVDMPVGTTSLGAILTSAGVVTAATAGTQRK